MRAAPKRKSVPTNPASWRSRPLVYATDAIRSFAIGYFSIVFVLIAYHIGIGALGIGVITAISVSIGIFITHFLNKLANKSGVKIPFIIAGILMTSTGLVALFAHSLLMLSLAALFGFLPPSGGIFVAAIAEGMLAQTPSDHRTRVFARNGLIVTMSGAVGALFASFPTLIGMSQRNGIQLLTILFSILGVMISIVGWLMVDSTSYTDHLKNQASRSPETDELKPLTQYDSSKSAINRITLLFIADSAGSGIVTPTLIIYWLRVHFGLNVVELSTLFFGLDVLSSVSFPLAVRISNRVGLLNTAVFTHIPSSILLIAVPFAPTGIVAALLLLARSVLVEMDVPTRQSYIASIVAPNMRRFAAARTSMGKQTGRAIGPAIGGFIYTSVGSLAPFMLGGIVKIAYDLTLWRSFRNIVVHEDPQSSWE